MGQTEEVTTIQNEIRKVIIGYCELAYTQIKQEYVGKNYIGITKLEPCSLLLPPLEGEAYPLGKYKLYRLVPDWILAEIKGYTVNKQVKDILVSYNEECSELLGYIDVIIVL